MVDLPTPKPPRMVRHLKVKGQRKLRRLGRQTARRYLLSHPNIHTCDLAFLDPAPASLCTAPAVRSLSGLSLILGLVSGPSATEHVSVNQWEATRKVDSRSVDGSGLHIQRCASTLHLHGGYHMHHGVMHTTCRTCSSSASLIRLVAVLSPASPSFPEAERRRSTLSSGREVDAAFISTPSVG